MATTFLEYLAERLMGPPTVSKGGGESYWPCPKCQHERFHTLPASPRYKHRVKCWSCGYRGDAFDLLAHFQPRWDYTMRKAFLNDLAEEWQQQPHDATTQPTQRPQGAQGHDRQLFSPGSAGSTSYDPAMDDPRNIEAAWANLTSAEHHILSTAVAIAKRHNVSVEGLAYYAYHTESWRAKQDAEHMAECENPECDWHICRIARGWTPEDIKADLVAQKQAKEAAQQAELAEIEKCIHRPYSRNSLNGTAKGAKL